MVGDVASKFVPQAVKTLVNPPSCTHKTLLYEHAFAYHRRGIYAFSYC